MGSRLASADGQNALPRAHKRAAGRQRRPGCGRAACRKGSACRAGRRTMARRARPLLSLGLSGQRCESTDAGRQHTTLVQDARLRWPDTFAQGPDGAIYMTASHIQDSPWFHKKGWVRIDFALFRFSPPGWRNRLGRWHQVEPNRSGDDNMGMRDALSREHGEGTQVAGKIW